jgi:transcriptional regulator with XRE-family HTH domain
MVLLRRVLGDTLRERRLDQRRTLRDVSTEAKVSLGYLSELERGQKEASSELLGSICEALGVQLSDVLREVSDTVALAEEMAGVLAPVGADQAETAESAPAEPVPAGAVPAGAVPAAAVQPGAVTNSVAMRGRPTLARSVGPAPRRSTREVVCAA